MDHGGTIEAELERLGCMPKWRGRYWLIRCPRHEDRAPSAQCFPDGWIQCHAGCGRFNINKVTGRRIVGEDVRVDYEVQKREEIKRGDFTQLWTDLDALPPSLDVKGIDGKTLNKLGWRSFPGGDGYRPGIFIPYFTLNRDKVPFFQIRHLEGDRRFTFARNITPILYGFEVIPKCQGRLCFTEGTRDAAILRSIGVPAVAIPSASSTKILEGLGNYCFDHNISLFAVCDKDPAGEQALKALQRPVTDLRTPVGKDVGDFLEQRGREALRAFYGHLQVTEGVI